jgi:hypothetical protein
MSDPNPRPGAAGPGRRAVGIVVAVVGIVAIVLVAVGLSRFAAGTTSPVASTPAVSSPSSAASAHASRSPEPGAGLVGAGDIGVCGSPDDEATAALVDRLPGTVFTLGDDAYEQGTEQQFRDCFGGSWGRFKDRITFPVPGNHEYETTGAAGYRAYFGAAATPLGETWYSRDVGSWHVIVLDATCDKVRGGCGLESPQVAWLRTDLAASAARCTLALWHQPRFSSGLHGNDQAVAPFWDALYAAGADLVLNGHDHDYERFVAQAPDGSADEPRGIAEIVVGTGGAALRRFETTRPNRAAGADTAHGVVQLTLGEGRWSSRFIPTEGSFSDEASGACH